MTALEAIDLGVRRGERLVLEGLTLGFARGEVTGIVGPNGAGKTTLLHHLAGLDRPERGRVVLDGRDLAGLPAGQRARRIAYLPQAATVVWPLRGRDLVALGRLPHGASLDRPASAQDGAAVERALQRIDATALADRPIDRLSQGERARLALARVLATEAEIVLADEPVASLDPAYALDAMAALRAEARRGACVVVSLHDLGLAARFADRLVLLVAGEVAAAGSVDEVMRPETLAAAYGVQFRAVSLDGVPQPVAWSRNGGDPEETPTR